MIKSQALLQRERGIAGTALPDVLAHSGAPRGSIYHHFPGGRAELSQAATQFAADWITGKLERALADRDVLAAHEAFVDAWLTILRDSQLSAGCAVAAGALAGPTDTGAQQAAKTGFKKWEALLCEAYRSHGLASDRAERLAVMSIASIEGALILSRAEGSTRPLEHVAAQLQHLLSAELGDPSADAPAT